MKILLVEDDTELCSGFASYIDKLDGITLSGVTNNSDKAVELIADTYPDAVILDLELHDGSGNGLLVLNALNSMPLPFRPYVIVTTNNSSSTTLETARKLGADFIMSKHQQDFSVKSVLDFLIMMKSVVSKNSDAQKNTEPSEQKNRRLRKRIDTELNFVGISPKALGYTYLAEAIQIIMREPQPNVCLVLADIHKKNEASIERAMQNAINRAWKQADVFDLLNHYTARISSEKGVPTLTEFIYYYANKLKE